MHSLLSRRLHFIAALLVLLNLTVLADEPYGAHEKLLLDFNWKFHLGDDWPDALRLDKAGTSSGPASKSFSDDSWRTVNLPHDWAVELPFDRNADGSHGFHPVGPGFPQNSIGWYRRTFDLPAEDSGKRIWLDFDGVYRDATVFVNGWIVGHHESGYSSFRYDITDIANFGGKNVIAVKVDASKFEGWFYEGAGIYRHVWLEKTSPVAIAPDGIFVYSTFKNNVPDRSGELHIQTRLDNHLTNAVRVAVTRVIYGPPGAGALTNLVMKFQQMVTVPPASEIEFTKLVKLPKHYQLWSPESPNLYRLVTLISGGVPGNRFARLDKVETVFGIRTVAFDANKGFLLNGQPYELKGTCNHQDMAGVGEALPDDLQYFRIATLKKFGCNAYRTSHNAPTPELLDACDRLGMIVMDENRLLGSDAQNMARWKDQILRDRNHPSVGLWSLANEEGAVEDTVQGGNVARTMQNLVQRLDPTRPVTYAAPEGDVYKGVNSVIEVRGWNYHPGPEMDRYHSEHPEQPNVGTEQGSTVSTRGIYENDPERGYVSAYDVNAPSWATTAEKWWSYFADRPWLSGGFGWTGFDYRGEPTPYSWPCINSHFGILDTCGFPKGNFYYYQAWWTTNTVLHLLPHWNWPGKEGQEIRVDALSNCKAVELFLNGQSLGRQTMQPNSKLTWQVKYEPGTLSAKGYDDAGNVIAETQNETTGDPVAIQLTPAWWGKQPPAANATPELNADGEDTAVFTVSALDAQGRPVPVAQNLVHFELTGPGKIIGVGNGDPSCHEPDQYIPTLPTRSIALSDWRWKLTPVPNRGRRIREYQADFDDSAWTILHPEGDATGATVLSEGQTAVFRAHLNVTEADLNNPGVQIRFNTIDDHGWIFVNDQLVGESHDWAAQPIFDIKRALHPGDNVIAVGVKNDGGTGGLDGNAQVEIIGAPVPLPWSRSLFNGLAEVIVQSTKDAGVIQLTAKADGLTPATVSVPSEACAPRPSVP